MKRLVLGTLAVGFIVGGVVAWPIVARQRESARRVEVQRQFIQKMIATRKNSPAWPQFVAGFNKDTRTSRPIFDHATRVEAFRLIGTPYPQAQDKIVANIHGFPATQKITVSDPAFAHDLENVVLDPNSYMDEVTMCMIQPAVAFRVWSGTKFVDCMICFHCNQLAVVENDPRVPQQEFGGDLNGRMKVMGQFDPAREQLLALTKEAFASDATVQGME